MQRSVSLFRNGRNQAVRIPREFELPGDSAIMRKEGDRLIIEPVRKRSILEVLDGLPPLDEADLEAFDAVEDLPPEPFEL